MPGTGAPSRSRARDRTIPRRGTQLLLIGAVAGLGLALPIAAAWHYGTFGVARGDDWSYLRTLFRWTDTGHLDFNNWVSMTLLGQLVLAAPLALVKHRDTTAVQVLTALLGLVGLLAVQWTANTLTRRPRRAALAALVVAAGPVWGILAVSFMTDVPAFALAMLSTALGVRGAARRAPLTPVRAGQHGPRLRRLHDPQLRRRSRSRDRGRRHCAGIACARPQGRGHHDREQRGGGGGCGRVHVGVGPDPGRQTVPPRVPRPPRGLHARRQGRRHPAAHRLVALAPGAAPRAGADRAARRGTRASRSRRRSWSSLAAGWRYPVCACPDSALPATT